MNLTKGANMKINQIIAEIHGMNRDDLNKVVEAVKYARSQAHRQMANTLKSGDTVFFDGRYGKTVKGTVIKTAIKYVQVDCGMDGKWRVPAAHLRLAA
jgi:hypothetical protein